MPLHQIHAGWYRMSGKQKESLSYLNLDTQRAQDTEPETTWSLGEQNSPFCNTSQHLLPQSANTDGVTLIINTCHGAYNMNNY
jgi:hypothetical protein